MGLFGSKQKAPEVPKQEIVYLDIYPDEKKIFEEICSKEGISCSYEPGPEGSVRCHFPAEFEQVIIKYLSFEPDEPDEPAEKKKDFNDLIADVQKQQTPDYLEKMGLAGEQPPSDEERAWADRVALEELKEPPAPLEETQRKKRQSLGRKNEVKIRLTDAELKTFKGRVKRSGLAQGEFLRSAALTGQIVINERSEIDVAILDEIAKIRAELGRQGGLLKMVIKPNEGQREFAPDEWAALIQAVRDMEKMKKRLSDLEVKMANGNYNAPYQQKR